MLAAYKVVVVDKRGEIQSRVFEGTRHVVCERNSTRNTELDARVIRVKVGVKHNRGILSASEIGREQGKNAVVWLGVLALRTVFPVEADASLRNLVGEEGRGRQRNKREKPRSKKGG